MQAPNIVYACTPEHSSGGGRSLASDGIELTEFGEGSVSQAKDGHNQSMEFRIWHECRDQVEFDVVGDNTLDTMETSVGGNAMF